MRTAGFVSAPRMPDVFHQPMFDHETAVGCVERSRRMRLPGRSLARQCNTMRFETLLQPLYYPIAVAGQHGAISLAMEDGSGKGGEPLGCRR